MGKKERYFNRFYLLNTFNYFNLLFLNWGIKAKRYKSVLLFQMNLV